MMSAFGVLTVCVALVGTSDTKNPSIQGGSGISPGGVVLVQPPVNLTFMESPLENCLSFNHRFKADM
ncbi:hypothetical protein L596_028970 [Steinernema carpocapsae]|uniref:Uncharacterized protein n=1 Tax=Steinernema carpocapsae TaxID=34508 RepID=A0A4U5LT88_STECR|nr:hypothetical protein L596_028970 [Steinernema carpocapsae]